ncbi:MAG: dTDP-4-dehydrorhamnose 3,5-epimerase family protein [Anaerolineae bacterium]|nr:dTDP-4-dehydrorhamnose 3,5-epimerase family protein [Anaerolineae bacterium]
MNEALIVRESGRIAGVGIVDLRAFADERGRFTETFRREWFPQVNWDRLQMNRSDSRRQVLRGLHWHRRQVDYWVVTRGRIRAVLVDLRRSSATLRSVKVIELQADSGPGLFIPAGVAHGFLALEDATLSYVVNNYYDNSDEQGLAWNDPQLGIPWGIEDPQLSARDRSNPTLAELESAGLPD